VGDSSRVLVLCPEVGESFPPPLLLHDRHSVRWLLGWFVPPCARGVTCSLVRSFVEEHSAHWLANGMDLHAGSRRAMRSGSWLRPR
jgi:hypothetical protein